MEQYILALDQGTTSSRCHPVRPDTRTSCGVAQKEFTQHLPQAGLGGARPHGDLVQPVRRADGGHGPDAASTPGTLPAIGITNQRETTIVWDKETGQPGLQRHRLAVPPHRGHVRDSSGGRRAGRTISGRTTGLLPDAYFSATKITVDSGPRGRGPGEGRGGASCSSAPWTPGCIWKLTGGAVHVTDYTNASRTMLYDIHNL